MTCSSSRCWSRPTGCVHATEELAAMRETLVADLPDYREVMVTVGNNSTIRLRKQVYSVPSRLIGVKLLARIYETASLFHGAAEVAQLPLARATAHRPRHHRSPGAQTRALANYRWREELFPRRFTAVYDHLERSSPAEADRRYLETQTRRRRPDGGGKRTGTPVRCPVINAAEHAMLDTWNDLRREWRQRPPLEVDLTAYDALLDDGSDGDDDPDGGNPTGTPKTPVTINPEVTMPPEADPTVMLLRLLFLTTMAGQYEAVMRRAEKGRLEPPASRPLLRERSGRARRTTHPLADSSDCPRPRRSAPRREAPSRQRGGTARAHRWRIRGSCRQRWPGLPGRGKTHFPPRWAASSSCGTASGCCSARRSSSSANC